MPTSAHLPKEHATGDYTIADLAELYPVSRATVYRVLERTREASCLPLPTVPTRADPWVYRELGLSNERLGCLCRYCWSTCGLAWWGGAFRTDS
ncbi:helix-turn-helix domain-containing protein [Streptomyces sp. NPDC001177]